jgi:hypothetical protein
LELAKGQSRSTDGGQGQNAEKSEVKPEDASGHRDQENGAATLHSMKQESAKALELKSPQ